MSQSTAEPNSMLTIEAQKSFRRTSFAHIPFFLTVAIAKACNSYSFIVVIDRECLLNQAPDRGLRLWKL
jgi:hypothetical protein